jgi:hypothetical protein
MGKELFSPMNKKSLISFVAILAMVMVVGIYITIRQFQSQSEKIAFLEKQISFNPASLGATPVDTSIVSSSDTNSASSGTLDLQNIDSADITSITSYYASAAEVGGYIIGETVSDPVGNRLDASGLISAYVNRADDYMQVWCGEGYKAVDASSFTNNPVSKSPAPLQGYGIQIPDISVASTLSVTCQEE